jgi:hypothetical protein
VVKFALNRFPCEKTCGFKIVTQEALKLSRLSFNMKANSVGKSFALAEIPSFCQVLLFEKRITVVVKWMDGWMDGLWTGKQIFIVSLSHSPIAHPSAFSTFRPTY